MSSQPSWDKDLRLEREFVSALRDLRLRALNMTGSRSFSHTEIGRSIGQHPSSLYNWENGVCLPGTFAAWKKWATALGMELSIELRPATKEK